LIFLYVESRAFENPLQAASGSKEPADQACEARSPDYLPSLLLPVLGLYALSTDLTEYDFVDMSVDVSVAVKAPKLVTDSETRTTLDRTGSKSLAWTLDAVSIAPAPRKDCEERGTRAVSCAGRDQKLGHPPLN
jgi:hypothetical protein